MADASVGCNCSPVSPDVFIGTFLPPWTDIKEEYGHHEGMSRIFASLFTLPSHPGLATSATGPSIVRISTRRSAFLCCRQPFSLDIEWSLSGLARQKASTEIPSWCQPVGLVSTPALRLARSQSREKWVIIYLAK